MSITKETRRASYAGIKNQTGPRRTLILELLERRPMTADELTEIMLHLRLIPYYDRNFVAPRLTELKEAGKVEVVSKKYCKRTDRQVAVWKLLEVE
jgi:hypothetical protein